jgi:hypothetical protein
MPASNSDFIKKLAGYATPTIEPMCICAAQDGNEVLDQASQSAVAYWMLGWNTEEIESVLEDEGFPEKIVERAMENLEDHAEEVLEQGPFATYESGQLVKLNNGQAGVLVRKNTDTIELRIGDDLVRIEPDHIDVHATAHLTKAYQMRLLAAEKLSLVAQEYPVKTNIKIDPSEVARNFPEGVEIENPEGKPIKLVEVNAVLDVLNKNIEKMLLYLLDLQVEYDKTKAELKELQDEYEERIAPIQQKESEQVRLLKDKVDKVFAAITEHQAVTDEEYGLAYELYGRFVILQQTIQFKVPNAAPTTLEELRAYYQKWNEFIDNQTGKLGAQLKSANEEIKKESVKIKEPFLQRIFGLFFPKKDRRGHLAQDESWVTRMWNSFTAWTDSIWQGAQDVYANWNNQLKPEGAAQLAEMDQMIEETKTAQEKAQADAATTAVVSAASRRV